MQYAPYSYSKLAIYDECPLKFALQYIAKAIPWAENAVFERGKYFHWRLHHFPKSPRFGFTFADLETVAEYDKHFDELIHTPFHQALFEHKIASEYEFYLDEDFRPIKNKKDAMLLGTIDYIGRHAKDVIHIADYKTGLSIGNSFQLEIYAVWALAASKSTNIVECMFAYLDKGDFAQFTYTRKDVDRLQEKIINKIKTIEADTEFGAIIGTHCRDCTGYKICQKHIKESFQ